MPKTYTATKPRPVRTPPHLSLRNVRIACGLTLDQVCQRISEALELPADKQFTRGALSAIESGLRGASQDTLDAIAVAYGLQPGDVVTDFEPVQRELRPAS